MSNNQAGKGSKPRPVVKSKYDEHFDAIKWKADQKQNQTSVIKKGKITYKY